MIDYIIVFLYLAITLVAGLMSGRGIKDMKDYSVADRNYPTSVLVATVTATVIGAENILAMSQRVFESGIVYIIVCMALPLEKLMIAKWIAPKIGRFQHMLSVGDIMGSLYGRVGKMATGLSGFMLSIGFVGAQVCAIGYFCQFFFGLPSFMGVVIGASIVIVYSAVGGIRAVTYTDVIQFMVLLVTIPIMSNVALDIAGGYGGLSLGLPREHLSIMPHDRTVAHYVTLFILFSIPFLDPAFMQRMLMSRNTHQIELSLKLTAVIQFIFYTIVGVLGLAALVVAPHIDAKNVVPYLINNVLPSGVKGLTVAGMLAVIMSTADSYLNAGSVAFIHDFLKPLCGNKITGKQELLLARMTVVVMGVASIVAALSKQCIMDIVLMFCNFWAPVVLVPLIAGIFGFQATKRAFIWSVISGVVTCLLWIRFMEPITGFDGLVPSIVANGLALFLVDRGNLKYTKIINHGYYQQPIKQTPEDAVVVDVSV